MKISKKYLTVLISLIALITVTVVLACGYFPPDYSYFHFFNPGISQSKYLKQGTSYDYFYNGYITPIRHFNSQNSDEWFEFFQKKIQRKDIDSILYSYSTEIIDSLIFRLRDSSYPLSNRLAKNAILSFPNNKLSISFLFYMGFAKRCEPFVTYSDDYTYNERTHEFMQVSDPRNDTVAIYKLITGGKTLLRNSIDPFISSRYFFQITRLYFHDREYQKCIDYYNHVPTKNLQTSMKYRMLGYVAGSYFKLKKYGYANFLYSKIFEEYKPMKGVVLSSFKPQEETDWSECLGYAKTKREKITIWVMLGIKEHPFRAMKEIYRLDPKSDYLELLLTRAVNISEDLFLTVPEYYWNDEDGYHDFKDSAVDTNLVSFIISVAKKGNTNKPYIWNLAAAYLLSAEKKYDQAKHFYSKAKVLVYSNEYLLTQIHKLEFVSKISQVSKIDKKFEEQILADILSYKKLRNGDYPDKANYINSEGVYFWTLRVLYEKYINNGDFVKAECLYQKNSEQFYENSSLHQQMLQFMEKKDKTKYEKFILSIYPITKTDIYDWDAVQLFYVGKYKEVISMYEACPGSGDKLLYADPFSIHINDCHDCDFKDTSQIKISKLTFVKKIISLINSLNKNPKITAEKYFTLANAFYNTTYFGNSRVFYQTAVKRYDDYIDVNATDTAKTTIPITNCSLAEKYYMLAFDNSTNSEFKAKCLFMAAKCEQNDFYVKRPLDYVGNFHAGKYFHQLEKDFSRTEYYQEIIKECGYFRKYVSKN